ncbi:hypothetical protein [Bradyrhizobium valentinum]|nr:hypothetical protein [Bradyrhizobium valentinum]
MAIAFARAPFCAQKETIFGWEFQLLLRGVSPAIILLRNDYPAQSL